MKHFVKIISLLMALMLLLSAVPLNIFADDTDSYHERVKKRWDNSFEESNYHGDLLDRHNYYYSYWIDEIESYGAVRTAILWATDNLIGKSLNQEAYEDYLGTLLSLLESGFPSSAAALSYQKIQQANTLDTMSTTLNIMLEAGMLDKVKEYAELGDDILDIVKIESTLAKTEDSVYVFAAATAAFEEKSTFLTAIIENTDNSKLKKAAKEQLRTITMEYKFVVEQENPGSILEGLHFAEQAMGEESYKAIGNLIKKHIKDHFETYIEKLVKEHGEEILGKVLSLSSNLMSKWELVSTGFKIGGEIMSIFYADDVELFREMRAMSEIYDALSVAFSESHLKVDRLNGKEQYEEICNFVTLGEALVYTHLRGDYCALESISGKKNTPENIYDLKHQSVEQLEKYHDTLASILPDPVTPQDYYRYINKQILVNDNEQHSRLASLETLKITGFKGLGEVNNIENIDYADGTGIVSAFIEDMDQDGILEMLLITAEKVTVAETIYANGLYQYGSPNAYDPEADCITIKAHLYDYKGGRIYERASNDFGVMLKSSFGHLLIGIERTEDDYYIFGKCYYENLSTYGSPTLMMAQITAEDDLHLDYCSPFRFGYINQGNTNEKLNISDPLQLDLMSFGKVSLYLNSDKSADEMRKNLGNRLLAYIDFDYPDWGSNEMYYSATDYTNLRKYLKNEGKDWESINLPKGTYLEEEEILLPNEAVERFVASVSEASGIRFTLNGSNEEGNLYSSSYTGMDDCILVVKWDGINNRLDSVAISHYSQTPPKEWNLIKDAVLIQPEIQLTEEQTAFARGDVNMGNYINGITVGDYTIAFGTVTSTFFRISYNH